MAGIIFFMWYFTIGVIFWKYHTNRIMSTNPQSIYDILNDNANRGLKSIIWYFSMIVVIITWPLIFVRRLFNIIKAK